MSLFGRRDEQESRDGLVRGARADGEPPDDAVRGERGIPTLRGAPSIQSRVSNVLAAALMLILGLGALTWYYTGALTRQRQVRQAAQALSATRAQGEMSLPALGRVEAPRPRTSATPVADVASADPATLTPASAREQPLEQAHSSWNPADATAPATSKTPGQLALERRLSGAAFARQSTIAALPDTRTAATSQSAEMPGFNNPGLENPAPTTRQQAGSRGEDGLTTLLRPSVTPAARAQVLATQRLLLPKGAFIDCTLETAIDSTLAGMTTCVTATDTFGVDGKIVLLERGTKLVGETRGQVGQGAARVFVLWTEARTPAGVIVPLDSPGTDELGRSGLPGDVNRHFWERFGAAMLISVIDGAVQATVQSANHGGGPIIYNPAASADVLTEVLKQTINIAPTIIKHHGDRIQVLVARALDFRPVYELRSLSTGR